jgi:HD-GYP domain-containing protein (c-di-GMP phosphodiesterase class II)
MLDPTYRPVALPAHWDGHPAPCDFFDAGGRLLLRAGSPILIREDHALRPNRVFCAASHAHRLSPSDPIGQLHQVGATLSSLAERAVHGHYVDALEFIDLAQAFFEVWSLDADACIGYVRLVRFERPSVRHTLLAALFSAEQATANGLQHESVLTVIGAALTMNLASMTLHDEMFSLVGGLTEEIRDEILAHPNASARLLNSIGTFPQDWLEAVAHHHESVDGSGYPNGFTRANIGLPARMLRIADTLAARLLGRKRRSPRHWSIQLARDAQRLIQHVFAADLEKLDRTLVRLLMTRLGTFPPGSLVRLNNGELAVVSRRQLGNNAMPHEVLAFLGPNGHPFETLRLRQIGLRECRIQGYVHDELSRLPAYDWQRAWAYCQ